MAQQNKEQQKKLLSEVMEADQKSGLYENHIGDANKMVTAVEWFCPKCDSYVSSESVTFEETHQICGTGVIIKETKHMAQQKLYTEDEIRRTFGSGFTEARFKRFMNELTPIELPIDEEIWDEANKYENFSNGLQFLRGAEWMRNKILNK